jgi:hypothetical protein
MTGYGSISRVETVDRVPTGAISAQTQGIHGREHQHKSYNASNFNYDLRRTNPMRPTARLFFLLE